MFTQQRTIFMYCVPPNRLENYGFENYYDDNLMRSLLPCPLKKRVRFIYSSSAEDCSGSKEASTDEC